MELSAGRNHGFQFLHTGANYYADIEARFGLKPEVIQELRDLDLMYDEEAGGRFFQFYSQTLPNGIFLEVVQRDPGYKRYGSPNAPFRIAAQKRLSRPAGMPRFESERL